MKMYTRKVPLTSPDHEIWLAVPAASRNFSCHWPLITVISEADLVNTTSTKETLPVIV